MGDGVAELRDRIAELETSLENMRRDRDQEATSAQHWRKRVEQAADALADVLPGEVGRLDLLARISALRGQLLTTQVERDEARADLAALQRLPEEDWASVCAVLIQGLTLHAHNDRPMAKAMLDALDRGKMYVNRLLARLTPSGQVAEDEKALRMEIQGYIERYGGRPEALAHFNSLLAALTRLASGAQGYEAAVADNAALLQALLDVAEMRLSGPTLAAMAAKLKAEPHPGAALLEQHRKEVAQAKNEGLEEAAEYFDKVATLWASFHAGTIAAQHAEAIRALKTCTDGSCAKCRSGEPCH